MSPIGRIFIVLNLFLAAAFLGWAAKAVASNQNWKQQYNDKAAELSAFVEAADTTESELRAAVTSQESEKVRFRTERDELDSEKSRLEQDLAQTQAIEAALRGDVTAIQATLADYNDRIGQVISEKDGAVEEARQLERERNAAQQAQEAAELAQREAERNLESAELSLSDQETTINGLGDQVSMLETKLEVLIDATGIDPQSIGMAAPLIRGAVTAVQSVEGDTLVALNVGTDEKVERGMSFHIYRGGMYKGEVKVRDVRDNMCSALVVTPVQGSVIAEGDSATTRL